MRLSHTGFRAVLCLSTALMMALSWPLWVSGGLFPKVPFLGGVRLLPVWASWVRFAASLVALVSASAGLWPKRSLWIALGISAWMVLEDQFRLQPWMYQFLLMGLALAACPTEEAIGLCRLFLIALYFHSGLSKFDRSFEFGMGYQFLEVAMRPFHVEPHLWPLSQQVGATLAMPAWEVAIAIGLVFRRTRPFALVGAVIQHAALLAIVGPWGLNHSTGVLVWNASLIVELLLLFGMVGVPVDTRSEVGCRLCQATRTMILLAAILPFGERWGLWDTWPSFGFYASHNERMILLVDPDAIEACPKSMRRHGSVVKFGSNRDWTHVDLSAWSLAERGTPLYPAARALNGVAEAIAARYCSPHFLTVFHSGRADRWTGQRSSLELIGLPAIRRHGDTYLFNAHPMP
ncbi:MAG: hypothetical protein JWN86_1219 [Planctomycetota bacterium]|nr:hypothetical protein [Planctomycetota bacterium]